MTKILGYHNWHDSSWCTLEDGAITKHVELERLLRTKEPMSNPVHAYMFERDLPMADIAVSCYPRSLSCDPHIMTVLNTFGIDNVHLYSHHLAHAAHAFFSSQFKDALIVTIDGGGIEDEQGNEITTGIYRGHDNKLDFVGHFPGVNVGCIWTRCTRYIFRFESGWPQGACQGSTMALAAFGDSQRFLIDTQSFFDPTSSGNHQRVCKAPQGHIKGMSVKDPRSPKHEYLHKFEELAQSDIQNAFDLAAGLQLATEEYVYGVLKQAGVEKHEYLCLSGGVALNSLMTGKIQKWFPNLKGIFIPPCPYDAGLSLGCVQYHWHHVMDKPRVYTSHSFSPYMGNSYTRQDVDRACAFYGDKICVKEEHPWVQQEHVINLLIQQKIVSVFNGHSECGRRALGNRSIIADPRSADMKDRVNDKVKHRQAWRPFAPSVLKEKACDWFAGTIDSPYMSFTAHVKEDKKHLVPAITHADGSARLQTVEKETNSWYHGFLTRWEAVSGVPMLLNTSQNDRTPIVDSPDDAVRCFLGTDIDALYFPEHNIVVTKRGSK